MTDRWDRGSAYESYVGRWSRPVAARFVEWLQVAPGAAWLDVGCGTGALSETILGTAAPASVRGVDPADGFVEHARAALDDPRASFAIGDARDLPEPSDTYDAVVSGLVLNFVPEPERALDEMARVARRDATVAAYVWDYAGEMQMMRILWDAAVALDPAAGEMDEGRRFPLCSRDGLHKLFTGAGLGHVEVRAIDVPTTFADFDDYWTPFLGGQGPAPGYVVSLSDERRALLRDEVMRRLPVADDGSIRLIARAWAARGTA